MHSEDLAPNVDAITRQYIGLVIQEALIPSLNELWETLERTRAGLSAKPDTSALEEAVEAKVFERLSGDIASFIDRKLDDQKASTTAAIEAITSGISALDASISDVSKRLDVASERISALEATPAPEPQTVKIDTAQISALAERIEALETKPEPAVCMDTVRSEATSAVIEQVAPSLTKLVTDSAADIHAQLDTAMADLRSQLAEVRDEDGKLRQIIDALDIKIKRWADTDRYSITRAQVMKAMRESKR